MRVENAITKRKLILNMQFPNQPQGYKERLRNLSTAPLYNTGLICLFLPAEESYCKKKADFAHAIPYSTSKGKKRGCERPPVLKDTGFVSVFFCGTKLLQK